jgi:outer membrane protein assembly factor BamB
LALLATSAAAHASDWPQLQGNPQRSGYTKDTVKPPFKVAWKHSFIPERVSRFTQAVTYGGKVFVGTESGNLYALRARDGTEIWKFACGSPIMHTAACGDGKVVVAALDGVVYAVDARSGEAAWKFAGDLMYGFSAAPLIAEATVYIGQRGGTFFALRLADGKLKWKFTPGAPILNSAAYDAGRVFFCDEKLYLHCLDAKTGGEAWKSQRLYGQSAKHYCPVVVNGYVIFRPMAAHCLTVNAIPEAEGKKLQEAVRSDEVQAGRLPKPLVDVQEKIVQSYKENPYNQDLFILDEATGKQAFVAPHTPSALALPGGAGPPAWDGKQSIFIPWEIGWPTHWARLDLVRQRYVELLAPKTIYGSPDETVNVAVGGNLLFILHCMEANAQYTGVYDLEKRVCHELAGRRLNGWNLSDCCQSGNNAASIADGRFYHIIFHELCAWTSAEGDHS